MMYSIVRIAFLLQLAVVVVQGSVTCRDNNNKPVAWFIVYKLPVKFLPNTNKIWIFPPHLYMDSNNETFQFSTQTLNGTNHAVSYTLSQLYSNHNSSEVGYIMYNDEKPDEAGGGYSEYYGHTKGVSAFDKSSGLWLLHSVPKFPPPTNSSYMYPENAVYFGQHLLCVSLPSASEVTKMGTQLMYNEPFIYDSNLPPSLKLTYPVMSEVITKNKTVKTNSTAYLNITSGTQFVSFAKNRRFAKDLYAELVAPTLHCDLQTETWQHEKRLNINSSCNQTFKVEDIEVIEEASYKLNFANYYDHSKYAVCESGYDAWVCVGDINRQISQEFRGGGTVCLLNKAVNQQYLSFIRKVWKCPGR